MKIAICVGHSRYIKGRRDGGAVSVGGINEWNYNNELADKIEEKLEHMGFDVGIYNEYVGTGYTSAMRWLAETLRKDDVDLAIELHFNSADTPATGHEWLYWHSSKKAQSLAMAIDHETRKLIPQLKARGCKPKFDGDRGAEFLKLTHCPAVIAEPFFGSNKFDWSTALAHQEEIAQAIVTGLSKAKDW